MITKGLRRSRTSGSGIWRVLGIWALGIFGLRVQQDDVRKHNDGTALVVTVLLMALVMIIILTMIITLEKPMVVRGVGGILGAFCVASPENIEFSTRTHRHFPPVEVLISELREHTNLLRLLESGGVPDAEA